jgi:hypothetical protein
MIGCCTVRKKDATSLDLNRGRAPGILIGSNFGGRRDSGTKRSHTKEITLRERKGLLIWSSTFILHFWLRSHVSYTCDVCSSAPRATCRGLRPGVVFTMMRYAVIIFQPRFIREFHLAHSWGLPSSRRVTHSPVIFSLASRVRTACMHDCYGTSGIFFGFCLRRHIPHKSSFIRVYLRVCARLKNETGTRFYSERFWWKFATNYMLISLSWTTHLAWKKVESINEISSAE